MVEKFFVVYIINILKCFPRTLMMLIQNVIFPSMYVVWYILMLPLQYLWSDLFWKLEGKIFDAYLTVVCAWLDHAGHSIYECGDDISKISDDEALVLVNHQGPTDIGTIMRAFHANDATRISKVISFDVEKSKHQQNENLRKNITQNFENHKKWVILFPEGGFLCKRKSGSQRYAKRQGLPVLEHVALPRIGAVQTIVETLGVVMPEKVLNSNTNNTNANSQRHGQLKWIVDVTIGYIEPIASLEYAIGHCGPRQVIVHYRCFPAHEIVGSKLDCDDDERESQIKNWMYKLFAEKEDLLSYFYRFNNFPASKNSSTYSQALRYTPLDNATLIGIHLIVVSAFYAFCKTLSFMDFF